MKVILLEDVENIGRQGQVMNVAAGYFRNCLRPRKWAIEDSPSNHKRLEQWRKRVALKHAGEKKQAEELAARLAGTPLVFTLRAGEKDRLFGSVTPTDIAARLAEAGFEIDRKKIIIEEAIKKLGTFTVKVRLHHDVTASLKVEVHKEEVVGEEKKEEAKEEAAK